MPEITDITGKKLYSLVPKEMGAVERIKKIIKEEDDEVWGVFYGARGSGKSLKAQRFAFAVDPTLNIDRVCFNKDEFIPAVINSKKQAVIGDEGISLFHSRQVMTKEGRLITELADQIRQNNLFVVLCIPDITKLDKDIIFSPNLKFICKVWKTKSQLKDQIKVTKGNCAYYFNANGDRRTEKIVQYEMKKKKDNKYLSCPVPHFTVKGDTISEDRPPFYPVDETAYRKKKEKVLDKYKKDTKTPIKITNRALVEEIVRRGPDCTKTKLAEVLNISRRQLYNLLPKDVKVI